MYLSSFKCSHRKSLKNCPDILLYELNNQCFVIEKIEYSFKAINISLNEH